MDIKAPDLGVDSAEVSEIMVAVGDVIAKDDNIVLLESDKASVEVPSSAAGKVTKINVAIGDQVSEGMVLIEVESADASDDNDDTAEEVTDSEQADDNNEDAPVEDDADAEEATDDAGEGASTTHALPDIGVDEAQVAEIMVSVGDTVSADESILLIESDKASVEVPAPEAGVVEKILVNAGDTVANGQDFIVIKAAGTPKAKPKADTAKTEDKADKPAPKTESKSQPAPTGEPKQAPAPTSTAAPAGKKLSEAEVNEKLVDVYAGPAVRKLARQLGVDITQVSGSALNDRILKEDLFAHVKNRLTTQQAAPAAQGAVSSGLPKLPDMSNVEIWGETETQDLSRLQKVSIPQLNYNTYLPQVTQFDLSDITETEKLRGELKGDMKAQGIA